MIAGAELGGGGLFGGLCNAARPYFFPDTAVCHGPLVIHWYHTCVNNMNKTDVIKIGRDPSLPPLLPSRLCSEERRRTVNDVVLLLLHSSLFLLSDCLSVSPSFTHLPFIGFGPRGCEAWLSTGAELSKLQQRCKGRGAGGKKRAKKLKEGCAFVWVCACVCVCVCGASTTVTFQPTGQHEAR